MAVGVYEPLISGFSRMGKTLFCPEIQAGIDLWRIVIFHAANGKKVM